MQPRVAPDGKAIACSLQGAIWLAPVGGGTLTCLTHGEGFDQEPVRSPDGRRLAFVHGPNQPGATSA